MKRYYGLRYFGGAKQLVTIPSYVHFLDGYNQVLVRGALQK